MIKLRDYQREAVNSVYEYWQKEKGNPLIVAPCGAGKSLIIGEVVKGVMQYPGTRVLVLAHRVELLEQNEAELKNLWPEAPTGFFSAGLGKRDYHANVTFAGIQTIANKIHLFEPFDICLIDEAHLLPRSALTQYGRTVDTLKKMRPTCRFIGLTATPYRLDSGYLYQGDDALFDKVSYDIPVQKLVDDGYLCEVVAKAGRQVADMTGVKKRMGEFNQKEMAAAFEQDNLLINACQQIIEEGQERKAWIVFCASVEQAEKVTDIMKSNGIDADIVTGAHGKTERKNTIERFKAGNLKCLVNVDVLTIGFNAPICDLAALIRATDSTALYVQIVGRIMRTYPNKKNALLLDFGGNVERHGPIDDVIVRAPGKGGGEAPAKTCPNCLMIVAAGVRNCPECEHEFPPPEPKIEVKAFSGAVLKSQREPEKLAVMFVRYHLHNKVGKPTSVKATYTTGKGSKNEWLMPEHGGFATQKTAHILMQRYKMSCPTTSVELLVALNKQKKPSYITVVKDGKYEVITKVEFDDEQRAVQKTNSAS